MKRNGTLNKLDSPSRLKVFVRVVSVLKLIRNSFILNFRLCNDPTVCRDLLRLGGIDRLVELCKTASERNYSDAVLVACLAVLRRVKHNLETKMREESEFGMTTTHVSEDFRNLSLILEQLDATDLVQPKLVESFVEYSSSSTSKHSYVWTAKLARLCNTIKCPTCDELRQLKSSTSSKRKPKMRILNAIAILLIYNFNGSVVQQCEWVARF